MAVEVPVLFKNSSAVADIDKQERTALSGVMVSSLSPPMNRRGTTVLFRKRVCV